MAETLAQGGRDGGKGAHCTPASGGSLPSLPPLLGRTGYYYLPGGPTKACGPNAQGRCRERTTQHLKSLRSVRSCLRRSEDVSHPDLTAALLECVLRFRSGSEQLS